MAHDYAEAQSLLSAQTTMFRVAERDHGITQKIVHLETRMSRTVIGEYARGETAMSLVAFRKLAKMKAFPSELLSLALDGTARHIEDGEEDHGCLDALGDDADDVAREVRRARSPTSPGGTDIVDIEAERIKRKAQRLRKRAEAAA